MAFSSFQLFPACIYHRLSSGPVSSPQIGQIITGDDVPSISMLHRHRGLLSCGTSLHLALKVTTIELRAEFQGYNLARDWHPTNVDQSL